MPELKIYSAPGQDSDGLDFLCNTIMSQSGRGVPVSLIKQDSQIGFMSTENEDGVKK